MNKTIEDIINRRSIRKYTDEPVREEDLQTVLQAGLFAASAMGRQQAIMVVIQDPETLNQLERLNASCVGRDPDTVHNFYGAKTVIVVLGQKGNPNACADGSLVMGNMMLAAHALGLGSCWINRALESFETEEGKRILKKAGVEGEYVGVGNLILGYPAGEYPLAKARENNRIFRI
ncbi:MAG: nitroreductase [Erysipelotrichaceae bacterium]|nr:nitroreductase [Erysipelotrichaceae bacterium]